MKSITIYTDPSHGWAKVSIKELIKLNIADKISTYSYMHKNGINAYLEEDCDLGLYLNTLDNNSIKTIVFSNNEKNNENKNEDNNEIENVIFNNNERNNIENFIFENQNIIIEKEITTINNDII
jgi:hypothetical protein